MQVKLRDVTLGKPSVSKLKTILIPWISFFHWQSKFPT